MDTMNKCIMQTNSSPSNRILISRNKGKSEFMKENLIKEIIELRDNGITKPILHLGKLSSDSLPIFDSNWSRLSAMFRSN